MTDEARKNLPRLYVPFTDSENISLSEGQQHYLRNVMRCAAGDRLRLFNGRDGEWLAEIKEVNKKNLLVSLSQKTREQKSCPDIRILAACVKKEALDLMIEKAAELGASQFTPVITDHTVVHRFNRERAQAISIEAAEQCERLDIMQADDLLPLKDVLKSWDKKRKLIFCIERDAAPAMAQALDELPAGPAALLVGPEGGFSAAETAVLKTYEWAVPVSLGPRVLRAETALIAALSCFQAIKGDWR